MSKSLKILKWVTFGLAVVALIGWITMLLWNWLVPELFGGPAITFWQSLGLLLLTKILFWGMGGKRHSHSSHWKYRYYQKWSSMPPEERAIFKEKMMAKWCKKPSGDSEVH
jgi:hypothetical protein